MEPSTLAAQTLSSESKESNVYCIKLDGDKCQCVYCGLVRDTYGKSRGRTDKDPLWTNTAAGRHFSEAHKADLMPVFPSDLLRAQQKAAYYLRTICRHKQALKFFKSGSYLRCWCNDPQNPQPVYNPFEHVIQQVELPGEYMLHASENSRQLPTFNSPRPETTKLSVLVPTPPSSANGKRKRRSLATGGIGPQKSGQLQQGVGPSNINEHLNSQQAQTSGGLTEKEQTQQWKNWIDVLEKRQLKEQIEKKLRILHGMATKTYAQGKAAGATFPVPADLNAKLNTAKQFLSNMISRLENSGFADAHGFTPQKRIIHEYYGYDYTYTRRIILWCLEEIGRLSELIHRVQALMSGQNDVGSGFPLQNVVFLGDYGEQQPQPQVQQDCYSMDSGYNAHYPSAGLQPQLPNYQQQQPVSGFPSYNPQYWDPTTGTWLPLNQQPEQRRGRARRMSLSGEDNALEKTRPLAARSRSLDSDKVQKIRYERSEEQALVVEMQDLKLRTADIISPPKYLMNDPSVKRARSGASTTMRGSKTLQASSSVLPQRGYSPSGACALKSALYRLTPGQSGSSSSAIALDSDVGNLVGSHVLQSAEECERVKEKWLADDSKQDVEVATTTQIPDPNDEQSAQRQLSEELPRTNAKVTQLTGSGSKLITKETLEESTLRLREPAVFDELNLKSFQNAKVNVEVGMFTVEVGAAHSDYGRDSEMFDVDVDDL
ncbi:hypothetical protein AAVH_14865 [Aphelenchoides avenae]|nr:hypothetical protein AAVH_14865 [Aphelenchus avenae]